MTGFDMIWVQMPQSPRDIESPVSPLRDILIITQLKHQFMNRLAILACGEASFPHSLTESVIR